MFKLPQHRLHFLILRAIPPCGKTIKQLSGGTNEIYKGKIAIILNLFFVNIQSFEGTKNDKDDKEKTKKQPAFFSDAR